MSFRNSLAFAAAATLIAAPVAAQDAPTRGSAPATEVSEIRNDERSGGATILLILAILAVVAGIVIAAGGGGDKNPPVSI